MAYINQRYVPQKEQSEEEKRRIAFQTQLLSLKKPPVDKTGYRRRFADINQGGLEATNYATKQRNEREASYLEALRNKINQANSRTISVSTGDGSGMYGGNIPTISGNGIKGFEGFINAITGQESGGNYGARNSSSGAMGRYQIMPGNLGGKHSGWDYEALGRDITPQQFMSKPTQRAATARYPSQQVDGANGPALAGAARAACAGVA